MAGQKIGEMFFDIVGRTKTLFKDIDKAQSKMKRAGRKMQRIGSKMTMGLTLPLAAAGGAALKFNADLNKAMADVESLMPGNTERVRELKKAVQDMAIATGQSTQNLSKGLYQLVSAFGDTADTTKLLEINAKAAAVSMGNMSQAIDFTSAVTKAYGNTSAEAVQHVADLGRRTTQIGKTTLPELASSIGRVTSRANTLNVSQEELFATFSALSGVTGSTSEVATQFAASLKALMNPSKNLSAIMGELGYETGAAMIEAEGFQGAMQKIAYTAKDAGLQLAEVFTRGEALTLALAMSGEQAESYANSLNEMNDSAGTLDESFNSLMEGIGSSEATWKQLKQVGVVAFQKLGEAISQNIKPETLKKLVDETDNLIEAFGDLTPAQQDLIIKAFAVIAALGPLVKVVGKVAGAFSWVAGVAGTLGAALSFVVTTAIIPIAEAFGILYESARAEGEGTFEYWAKGWDLIRRQMITAWEDIKNFFSSLPAWFADTAKNIYTGVKKWLVDRWQSIVSDVQHQIDRVKAAFQGLYHAVVGGSIVPDMIEDVKAWFNRLGSDAMVYPVEFATKEAKKRFLDFAKSTKRIVADLGKSLKNIWNFAELTGDKWGALEEEARVLERAMRKMTDSGIDPQDEALQELWQRYIAIRGALQIHKKAQENAREATTKHTTAIDQQTESIIAQEKAAFKRDTTLPPERGVAEARESIEAHKAVSEQIDRIIERLAQAQKATREWAKISGDALGSLKEQARLLESNIKSLLAIPGVTAEHPLVRDLRKELEATQKALAFGEEFEGAKAQADELQSTTGQIAEDSEKTEGWLERWGSKLRDARQWMRMLGVESDSILGKIMNAAEAFQTFGGGTTGWAGGLAALFDVDISEIVDAIADGFENIFKWTFRQLESIFRGVLNTMKGIWETGIRSLKSTFRWLINALKNVFGWIVDALGGVWKGVKSVGETAWDIVKAPFEFVGDIFGLAEGGQIRSPGTAVVGEEGPELLHLPRGAEIEPLSAARGLQNITTIIELDGREIARKTLPAQAKEMRLQGVTH